MPGPRPKPAAIKAQKAPVRSKRQAPPPSVETAAGQVRVPPPKHLQGKALDEWNLRAVDLVELKLLTKVDAGAFARYCHNVARWWGMMEVLTKEGETYTVESTHGKYIRPHPLTARADALENRLIALEDRFGLNPAERQRIMQGRAQGGFSGDLFDEPKASAPGEPGSPAAPATASASPVGLLN